MYVRNNPLPYNDPLGLDASDMLCNFSFQCQIGRFVWNNTVVPAVNSYDWYQTASDKDRSAFWAGVGTGIVVGVAAGATIGGICVVTIGTGCPTAVIIGGIAAGYLGSVASGETYRAVGGESEGGYRASTFWGGVGGSAGFGIETYGALLAGATLTTVTTNGPVSTSTFWDTLESSRFWSKASFDAPLDSLIYHVGEHAPAEITAGEYTQDALALGTCSGIWAYPHRFAFSERRDG